LGERNNSQIPKYDEQYEK